MIALALIALAMLALVIIGKRSEASLTSDNGAGPSLFPLPGLPDDEVAIIHEVANEMGIDPTALAALRKTEAGGPGREFGVLSVSAPTYYEQARIAAQSISNAIGRAGTKGIMVFDAGGRYTAEFLHDFSARYAPIGAENDPAGLNKNHARNLVSWYNVFNNRV